MHSLALLVLAAVAAASPLNTVERGPELMRINPGNIEAIKSAEKSQSFNLGDELLITRPILPASVAATAVSNPVVYRPIRGVTQGEFKLTSPTTRSGWLNVMPSKTEGLFHFSQDAMQQGQQLEGGSSSKYIEVIEPRSGRAGWLKVEPSKTEGLFKVDALQQSQQLESADYPSYYITGKKHSARKVDVYPSKFEFVKADAMQQSQQLDTGKRTVIGRKERHGATKFEARPGHMEYVKADAMQQSQQLEGGKHIFTEGTRGGRAGWLKVEPEKTEGLFKMDAMVYNPVLIPDILPMEPRQGEYLVLNPIARTDAMQHHQQLSEFGLGGQQEGQIE